MKKTCSGCKALKKIFGKHHCEAGKKIDQIYFDKISINARPLEHCIKIKTYRQYLNWQKYSQKHL